MARADLLLNLVRAASARDDRALARTIEALVAEERGKRHHLLADRLEEAALRGAANSRGWEGEPQLSDPVPGVEITLPQRSLSDLVLPLGVREAVDEFVEEQQRIELLRAHGLEPRHRLLVTGPPGNGKTSLAEAIAESLCVPLVRVRYESVVGSYLGETGARLAQVFKFSRARHCVLFLDEFDAIAKERGDEHETGEIKRVVSSLLLLIDDLPSHVVAVAASNHPELLDRAVHRRFELHLTLGAPDHAQREAYFERFLVSKEHRLGVSTRRLADATEGASFSQLSDLVLDIRRRRILDPGVDPRRLVERRIRRFREEVDGA